MKGKWEIMGNGGEKKGKLEIMKEFSQVLLSSKCYDGIHVEFKKKLATLREIALEGSPSKTENPLASPWI